MEGAVLVRRLVGPIKEGRWKAGLNYRDNAHVTRCNAQKLPPATYQLKDVTDKRHTQIPESKIVMLAAPGIEPGSSSIPAPRAVRLPSC